MLVRELTQEDAPEYSRVCALGWEVLSNLEDVERDLAIIGDTHAASSNTA